MVLNISKTNLEGVYTYAATPFIDERGSFSRLFCAKELAEILGDRQIVNINQSTNTHKGTVRGLHYQNPPFAEMKIVRCTQGKIFDVAVDIKKDSPTFLQWIGVELSPENGVAIIIPEGFAHGFQALEANSTVSYCVTQYYNTTADSVINPQDPSIAIDWPLKPDHMSKKDAGCAFIDESFTGLEL